MKGLIAGGDEAMNDREDSDVLDAARIAAAQKVELYDWRLAGRCCGSGNCRTIRSAVPFRQSM